MKSLLTVLLFFAFGISPVFAREDSLLVNLVKTMEDVPKYDQQKIQKIAELKKDLSNAQGASPEALFSKNALIYDEYKSFICDSAYMYSIKLLELARASKQQTLLVNAQLKMSFVLLSAGFYKECYDSLSVIRVPQSDTALRSEYYFLWGRYYYDLAGYIYDNNYSFKYDITAGSYIDSALLLVDKNSFEYKYYSGLRLLKLDKLDEAKAFLENILAQPNLTYHQVALAASTLSDIYLRGGNNAKGVALLSLAAEADIKSATKETFASYYLSNLLYKTGDLKNAALLIENAIQNAEYYGARQRKLQASSISPIIEGERIAGIEKQKSLLIRYAIVLTLLVITLIILAYIIRRNLKRLKITQKALSLAHEQEQKINQQLKLANLNLEEANDKLAESSKIKEEYIGYFFNTDSEFYGKVDKIKQTIEKKLQEKKYDEIKFFLNKIDAQKEKEELIGNFDRLFLRLFPDFIEKLNALLRPEERIKLKDNELLNNDLRIFALIRMGINDTDKIASILDYSVKTIYTYKSKIKSKSNIPNDEFEDHVMQIKAH
jgi:hypothetical protein